MNYDEVLDNCYVGIYSLRTYLRKLLKKLWMEEEQFNSKRPWGDSDWQFEVYEALIKYGFDFGTIDEDGYIEDIDFQKAEEVMKEIIMRL